MSELEQYRLAVIAAVTELGPEYLAVAKRWLGLPVTGLWLHGSVLDPERFGEASDVDVLVTVDLPGAPVGVLREAGDALHGRLREPVGGGVLDVGVINLPAPYDRWTKPTRRIA